ncbi:cDerlin-2 [Hyphodiscus hymeniophilus]|uniref:Derlin n=1 Tax=Hyphodiscus hymeniophilus TaxID=353542 RepID=A0A9P7AZ55_9HELO|nr:cDerlin-2 [Hyphodiscus hymeniophilus]
MAGLHFSSYHGRRPCDVVRYLFLQVLLIYVYGAKLEIASPRFSQRADFVTYICFVCGIILVFAGALALAFITSAIRDSWDQPITFIIVKMPAQYLPWAILLLTLIIGGPQSAMIQATGLAAAYVYDFCTGLYPGLGVKRNLVTTPGWMKKVFGTQSMVERPYGTVSTGVTGKAAWGLDMSWKRFGPGRTLGEEDSSADGQRPKGLVLAAMVMGGFLVVCGLLGYFFVMYGVADDWSSGVDVGSLARVGDKTATPETD